MAHCDIPFMDIFSWVMMQVDGRRPKISPVTTVTRPCTSLGSFSTSLGSPRSEGEPTYVPQDRPTTVSRTLLQTDGRVVRLTPLSVARDLQTVVRTQAENLWYPV